MPRSVACTNKNGGENLFHLNFYFIILFLSAEYFVWAFVAKIPFYRNLLSASSYDSAFFLIGFRKHLHRQRPLSSHENFTRAAWGEIKACARQICGERQRQKCFKSAFRRFPRDPPLMRYQSNEVRIPATDVILILIKKRRG